MDVNICGSPTTGKVQLSSNAPPLLTSITSASPLTPLTPVAALDSATNGNPDSGFASNASPTREQVQQAVDNINASLFEHGNHKSVQFVIDPDTKQVVVQVVDPARKMVIRQIPSEEVIQMGMALGKKLGQVINQEV